MSSDNIISDLVPACPDQVEPRDPLLQSGQPWINPTRCRERLNDVLSQWIIPNLQRLPGRRAGLLTHTRRWMSLYTEVCA